MIERGKQGRREQEWRRDGAERRGVKGGKPEIIER
jgi:hypothetical protein